jgi:hypothetical protein
VQNAWIRLENLRTLVAYGTGTNGINADNARTHLAAIRAWAAGAHP